jgi:hypothetical protein
MPDSSLQEVNPSGSPSYITSTCKNHMLKCKTLINTKKKKKRGIKTGDKKTATHTAVQHYK